MNQCTFWVEKNGKQQSDLEAALRTGQKVVQFGVMSDAVFVVTDGLGRKQDLKTNDPDQPDRSADTPPQ